MIARELFAAEGVRGMYRGLSGIWTKEVPGSFIYFGSYEMAKLAFRATRGSHHLSKFSYNFMCSSMIGAVHAESWKT